MMKFNEHLLCMRVLVLLCENPHFSPPVGHIASLECMGYFKICLIFYIFLYSIISALSQLRIFLGYLYGCRWSIYVRIFVLRLCFGDRAVRVTMGDVNVKDTDIREF